ncbi:MAG: T9SS type B sorting domain-containing protein [Chitinophagales bacterium]|nr:T9SS type B sorting domain-containing protein [Chitinophagales bacterium]
MTVIRLLVFIAFSFIALNSNAQMRITGDSILCGDSLVLEANVRNISATEYRVDSIGYSPFPFGGFQLIFSGANQLFNGLGMGFNFCFFGNQYNSISIGKSGWLSFSVNPPGSTNYNPTPLPSAAAGMPINSIMGLWTDHSAELCAFPCTWIQTGGVAPFRRYVVTYVNLPHNTCADTSFFQIILYETTNIIECHIGYKPFCPTGVGGGAATIGIQNITGTTAYTPPNRNVANWTRVNESWRFVPNNISWFDATNTNIGSGDSIKLLPSGPTYIYAQSQTCNGDTVMDTIVIESPLVSAIISGNGNYTSCRDSFIVTATDPIPRIGSWTVVSGGVTLDDPDSLSTWVRGISGTTQLAWSVFNGCDTIVDSVTIFYSPPNFNFTDSLLPSCPNDSSGEIHVNLAGGNTPYIFNWSVGSGNPNLSAPTGQVSLTMVDSLGCSLDTAFFVPQYAPQNPIAFSSNIQCHGDSTGTVSGFTFPGGFEPWEYALVSPDSFQTSSTFTGLPAGNYDLYFRDSVGCLYVRNAVVAQPDSFDVTLALINPVCGNDTTGSVEVLVSGALPPYQYSIDTPNYQGSNMFMNLPVGPDTVFIRDNIGCITSVAFLLTSAPPLIISIDTLSAIDCYLAANASIELTATGGIGNYLFSDDNLMYFQDSVFTGISADTFSFYVSDSLNCIDSFDVVFTEPDSLYITSTGSSLDCFGDSDGTIAVSGIGGTLPYTFVLSNDTISTDTFFNLIAGTYDSIYIVDANGCVAVTADSVVSPPPFVVDSSFADSVLCDMGNDGELIMYVSGGTPGYTYSLDNFTYQADSNFSGLSAGNYTLYAMDMNGCIVQTMDTIHQPPSLIDANLADSLLTDVSCNGQSDGQAIIIPTSGIPPYMYSIDGGTNFQSSDTFMNLSAGLYSVLVSDANGCTSQTDFTITEPLAFQLTVSTTSTNCFNGSDGMITIAASGGTDPYIYSIDNGNNYQVDSFYNGLSSGGYQILVLDSNGCSSSDTAFVSEPSEFIITALPSAVSCFSYSDGSVEIVATGGTPPFIAYSISDDGINFTSQNNNIFSSLPSGNYVAVASDGNGCPANTTFDILEPPLDTFNIQIDPTSCFGAQYVNGVINIAGANVNAPYLFSLDGSSFSSDTLYPGLASGLHTLIWQNINGCFDTLELFVEEPDPILVFIDPDTLVLPLSQSQQVLSTILGPTNITYQWLPSSGLSCSDCPDPVVSTFGPSPAIYTLLVEVDDADANPPCFGEGTLVVIIDHQPRYFFPNAFTPNGDGENDILYVYGEHIKAIDLQIYDRWGNKVFASNTQSFGWDGRYKGEMLSPGVYSYKLTVEYLSGQRDYEQGSVTLMR